jgi:C4-dicarboxylate-specific signal transduction histidine kinase
MNEPIVEVIGLAHGEFVKNGVTVRTELGDSLPPIQGDRVQLQQVMLNLVINAIQAMSDVRDSKRELDVTTGVVESGESVRVAVRDTGPGPSAETSKVCFNDHASILKLYLLVRIHLRAQVSSQQQLCRVTS